MCHLVIAWVADTAEGVPIRSAQAQAFQRPRQQQLFRRAGQIIDSPLDRAVDLDEGERGLDFDVDGRQVGRLAGDLAIAHEHAITDRRAAAGAQLAAVKRGHGRRAIAVAHGDLADHQGGNQAAAP